MVKKTNFNTKVTEIEDKISSIAGLATNSVLTAVENKIPDVSSLVKKTDYNTKINDIEKNITNHNHDKYITTPEFNTMVASTFNARLAAQTDLIIKREFDIKLEGISDRVTKNKTKHLLVENELKKLKTLGLSYFWSKNYFEGNDGAQKCINKIYKYMTSISKIAYIDKLDDLVNENNNTHHRTIKMKPIDVKDNLYINIGKEFNDKDPKFKVGDHVRISKYKNIFAKGYTPNWSEEIFVIK